VTAPLDGKIGGTKSHSLYKMCKRQAMP
jgi:hypothetical protein